jgi:hypothetical protein
MILDIAPRTAWSAYVRGFNFFGVGGEGENVAGLALAAQGGGCMVS